MATPVVNCPELDPDLGSILHEEIDRLPEVERLPVVLCDLEGLTYEQAAGCLHWTVPALGCRLSKARKRLRDRLIRRGVTATVLGALTAARVASAAVPAMWSRTAVVAATTGSTSAVVIALTQTIIRGMLITKAADCRDSHAGGGHLRVGRSHRRGCGQIRRSPTGDDTRLRKGPDG
jgi:Sigma-70, region 4